jgi:hypothetical protein
MPASVKAMLKARNKSGGGKKAGGKKTTKGSLHPKFKARMGNPKGK